MKRKLLNNARLYLILDRQVNSYDQLFEIAKKSISAGVDIIQLRDKNGFDNDILNFSKSIIKLTKGEIPYIINDRIDLALKCCASGVHLGQDDVPIAIARRLLGPNALIGISCQTLAHVKNAMNNGADYIGFGSIFKTLTKPQRRPMDKKLLKKVAMNVKIPIFAIGGIQLDNIDTLKNIGVHRIAVCRAVCQAKNIENAVLQFKKSTE